MTELVLIEKSGTSAIIRMNRGAKQNALSRELFAAIDAALATLDGEPSVRGIIITGKDGIELNTIHQHLCNSFLGLVVIKSTARHQ